MNTKAEVMGDRDDSCYYLVYVGTKPNSQRRGYAAKLIDDVIDKVTFFPGTFPLRPISCLAVSSILCLHAVPANDSGFQ